MRRTVVPGALVALLLAAPVTLASKPYPATAAVWSYGFQSPVEQQTPGGATQPDRSLWVTNPTRGDGPAACVWDADDQVSIGFSGLLEAGQSVSHTQCLIGDWSGHLAGISTTTDGLAVVVSIDGVASASRCLVGPEYDRDYPAFSPIAGSNGGVGVWHTVTWTVTNTTSRTIRRIAADATVMVVAGSLTDPSGPVARWCQAAPVRHGTWPGPTWYAA